MLYTVYIYGNRMEDHTSYVYMIFEFPPHNYSITPTATELLCIQWYLQ